MQPAPADIEPLTTTTGPQMPLHARTAWTTTLGQLAIVLALALLAGVLADLSGSLGIALLLPAACYAVIAYFGYYARRPHAALAGAAYD